MRIFIDTEFLELEDDIALLSVGMVREDGLTYYAEVFECDKSLANNWVKENVLPYLSGPVKFKLEIASDLAIFCSEATEFWAYGIPDLDYNLITRLFRGKIPDGWPKGAYEVMTRYKTSSFIFPPEQTTIKHHALNDALWVKKIYESQS